MAASPDSPHRISPPGRRRREEGSPVGEAMVWASRIIAVGLAMFLPAVAGGWLDSRLGTGFLGIVGLATGFVYGRAARATQARG
ncbi:MAG: hypothetical protein ACKOHK_02465, partial [Planctomycetia bacterium]